MQTENTADNSLEIPKEIYIKNIRKINDMKDINDMNYKKKINLIDNETTQPSKFRSKNWAEINDDASGTYGTSSQVKFKDTLRLSRILKTSNKICEVIFYDM